MVTLKTDKKESTAPQRTLPLPRPMTMQLTDAFMNRRSGYEFSDEPISDEDLACILWAAEGNNGKSPKDEHYTTPTTFNWREIDVYVVKANGVWKWEPNKSVLTFIHDQDRRKDMCLIQPLVKNAPVHLVYVYDEAKTQGLMTDLAMNIVKVAKRGDWSQMTKNVLNHAPLIDIGAKAMAVYMACAALNINCLARLTFDAQKVHKTLLLSDTQKPLCVQTLGYKPKGLLDLML